MIDSVFTGKAVLGSGSEPGCAVCDLLYAGCSVVTGFHFIKNKPDYLNCEAL